MEKPILFNTEMVQAILEGRKTVTRRIVKPKSRNAAGFTVTYDYNNNFTDVYDHDANERMFDSPQSRYRVGDILYVRETWTTIDNLKNYADVEMDEDIKYLYKCDDNGKEHVFIDIGVKRWKPSIHMPKEAARIFLEVTNIRVERLQEITEDEAIKEGIRQYTKDGEVFKYAANEEQYEWSKMPRNPIEAFKKLWDSCYDWPKCWTYNPWVWVIEFKVKEVKN